MLRFLVTNPGLKLLAIVIALLVWTFVSAPRREKPIEQPFEVPVVFSGVPPNLIITGTVADKASIRLRGTRSNLNSLPVQNMAATLDLSNVRAGDVTMPITEQSLNIPPDVDLVSIDPAKISFRLEPLRQRDVPIRPFLVGSLPNDYELGDVTVTPPAALVSGPASLVNKISEVATERVILTGRTSSFEVTVGLVSDYALMRVLQPASVLVRVTVTAPQPAPPEATETTEAAPTK